MAKKKYFYELWQEAVLDPTKERLDLAEKALELTFSFNLENIHSYKKTKQTIANLRTQGVNSRLHKIQKRLHPILTKKLHTETKGANENGSRHTRSTAKNK